MRKVKNILYLKNNTYLVPGQKYGCIYDLDSGYLYHISKDLYELLNVINLQEVHYDDINNQSAIKAIDNLISNGLLLTGDTKQTSDINSISQKTPKINFAWIEITTKCNLKCIHCYNESSSQCHTEMSIESFKNTIDSLVNLNVKNIQIIGGEPFVIQEKLKQMLDYAINKFDSIEIFTNGTLIADWWFEYFKSNNIKLALSVYSYDNSMHDKVTTLPGSHQKTLSTIEKIKKYQIKYRVCNTIMKNIELGEKNTELFELNPNKDIVRMSGRGNISLLSKELILKKMITKDTFSKPINKRIFFRSIGMHNCFGSKIYIGSNNEIYPCVMERRISHGKINETKQIVLDSNILNLNKDHIKECKCCEFRYACFDCRPDSLVDNILEKPWYCTYNPITGTWEDAEKKAEEILSNEKYKF